MYSVSDVAKMLNVNEETIRRWIREGKLNAKRAVGRGGNTLYMEDILAFANCPPKNHLPALEVWLKENGFAYEKVDDPSTVGATDVAKTVSAAVTTAGAFAISPLFGAVKTAYDLKQASKRKSCKTYSIRLTDVEKPSGENTDSENDTPDEFDPRAEKNSSAPSANDKTPNESAPAQAPSHTGVLEEIARAKQLLDAEILTAEEFAEIKAKLIAKI